jgi:hypothetical protein
MNTKTWEVITNMGKQAGLESALKKSKYESRHTSAPETLSIWLAPERRIDDNSLRSLFKQ